MFRHIHVLAPSKLQSLRIHCWTAQIGFSDVRSSSDSARSSKQATAALRLLHIATSTAGAARGCSLQNPSGAGSKRAPGRSTQGQTLSWPQAAFLFSTCRGLTTLPMQNWPYSERFGICSNKYSRKIMTLL